MVDFHAQEVIEEINDVVSEHLDSLDSFEDLEARAYASEDLLQEVLDKLLPLVERGG